MSLIDMNILSTRRTTCTCCFGVTYTERLHTQCLKKTCTAHGWEIYLRRKHESLFVLWRYQVRIKGKEPPNHIVEIDVTRLLEGIKSLVLIRSILKVEQFGRFTTSWTFFDAFRIIKKIMQTLDY